LAFGVFIPNKFDFEFDFAFCFDAVADALFGVGLLIVVVAFREDSGGYTFW